MEQPFYFLYFFNTYKKVFWEFFDFSPSFLFCDNSYNNC